MSIENRLLNIKGIIDPHLHLFDLELGYYQWLKSSQAPFWPDKSKIARNFSEQDLQLAADMPLVGFVHIEAGFDNQQPWREIDWLETHCQLPFKSVACADLCSAQFPDVIQQLKQRSSVVGIRHILDEDASKILNHPLTRHHFANLADLNWRFDAQLSLVDTAGVDALLQLFKQFPNVAVLINHGGWPPQRKQNAERQIWAENLQKLAEHNNVAIKMSGWEMIERTWNVSDISGCINTCLRVFGAERVMLASNFPLCTFSHSYTQLWQNYQREFGLTDSLWQQLSATNAAHWYNVTP
ncbi:amidohydrolase family protein [Paraglaciecola hydrolytica]|uniref:Amidohydrolase-related domain-containing protein n=1 Tax=Paraglaciecola hydrolytica TaxID=1799789 RepID=A0A148KMW7_9ALTE|nr:amidohydrolase family protein [Paraglaciecola hydrolytica]KXI27652.1 hypothetical protein AX660_19025 [Paraglaciecola hydrolytica]